MYFFFNSMRRIVVSNPKFLELQNTSLSLLLMLYSKTMSHLAYTNLILSKV